MALKRQVAFIIHRLSSRDKYMDIACQFPSRRRLYGEGTYFVVS